MLESDAKFEKKSDLWFGKWHEEFGKFSLEHTKVLKLGLLFGPFIQSRKCMSLKFTRVYELKIYKGVVCYDNEEWRKIWKEIDLSVQNWHKEFDKFLTRALENLKNLHFNGMLLTKVYNSWA